MQQYGRRLLGANAHQMKSNKNLNWEKNVWTQYFEGHAKKSWAKQEIRIIKCKNVATKALEQINCSNYNSRKEIH